MNINTLNMNIEKTPAQYADIKYVNKWIDSRSQQGGKKSKELKVGFHNPEMWKVRDVNWSAERMRATEEEYPKKRILDAHKKYKTFNGVITHLGIWHGTYVRLCEVYKIKPILWDKTTKNGGPSKLTIVYKLIEDKSGKPEVYDSMKELKRIIGKKEVKGTMRTHNDDKITYLKKIKYCMDRDGRRIRIYYTGKQIPFIKSDGTISKRDWSRQVQVYELVEEFVGEFPSREEVYRTIGNVAIRSVHKGNTAKSGGSWQSNGYRFYDLN